MDRVRFITHRGKQVLFADMTNSEPAEALKISEEVRQAVSSQPENSVLILAEVTGAKLDKKALDAVKAAAARNRPFVKRSAMVGAGKEHTALFEALRIFSRRDYHRFESKEEALDWLTS